LTQVNKAHFLLSNLLVCRRLELGVASDPFASSFYCWSASSLLVISSCQHSAE